MNTNYNSVYALHIKQFIETKRTFGFKYKTPACILGQIDKLAAKRKETSAGITKDFVQTWGTRQLNETGHYYYTRVRVLAQFSSYLCDMGIISYIPKLPPFPKCTFIPYIFSPKEMDAIFKACDKLRLSVTQMDSDIISIPVLIRLLYSTGLRISEALALRNEDVNLSDKYLRVKDCKNGKERIIPISNSLVSACKEYVKYRCQLPLGKIKSGYFFVKLNGSRCSDQCVRNWFKECLNKAGIGHIEGKHSPRVHDLRHTFAVTSLANMADAGIDLYASLPILSNYLGHQGLGSTNHYVRLTTNMYPDLIRDVDTISLDVFPKFKNYENH